ncbi:MAG: GTPase [Lachnospiraceae bacterium]|nr:GTPase [Lachnospiraceae bacterium]
MKPVFVINGFLESGKTEFINYTLAQPYFQTKGRTLLIVCEEGEVEYSKELLFKSKTDLVVLEDRDDFTPDKLLSYEKEFKPERIIIEWNGMWNYKEISLPQGWSIEQQITTIDASTFVNYYTNMRSLLAEMLRNSEMIIFNRCDDHIDELPSFKRNIKAVNQSADIIFEGRDGEITTIFEDDLPFDLNAPVIELDNQGYGIWYIDSLDNVDRYVGKTISFTAMCLIPPEFPKGYFVPGRMAMTCCADDMAFLGFACKYDKAASLKDRQWIRITARVDKEYFEDYQGVGPVLKAISIENTAKPKDDIISFS